MNIEICKIPAFPQYGIIVDNMYDWECASSTEKETMRLAKAKYPGKEIKSFDHPDHYSNKNEDDK